MQLKLESAYNVSDEGEQNVLSLVTDINSQPNHRIGPYLFTELVLWAYMRSRAIKKQGFQKYEPPSRLQNSKYDLNKAMCDAFRSARDEDVRVPDNYVRKVVGKICAGYKVTIAPQPTSDAIAPSQRQLAAPTPTPSSPAPVNNGPRFA